MIYMYVLCIGQTTSQQNVCIYYFTFMSEPFILSLPVFGGMEGGHFWILLLSNYTQKKPLWTNNFHATIQLQIFIKSAKLICMCCIDTCYCSSQQLFCLYLILTFSMLSMNTTNHMGSNFGDVAVVWVSMWSKSFSVFIAQTERERERGKEEIFIQQLLFKK